MKFHMEGAFDLAEIKELVTFVRRLDYGRSDRVIRMWMSDESMSSEQAAAMLHQMGLHHQFVIPDDQTIYFKDEGGDKE